MTISNLSVTVICHPGKHPVSALQEICSKKRWDNPVYTLIDHGGPAHNKTFSYEVSERSQRDL